MTKPEPKWLTFLGFSESIRFALIHFDLPLTKFQSLISVEFIMPNVLCILPLIKPSFLSFNPFAVMKIVLVLLEIAELSKCPSIINK